MADEFFVSNNGGNTVDEISSTGVVTPFATEDLSGPTGMVFNSSGDLFVANNGFGYIEEFSATGSPIGVFASGLNNPRGMVIDGAGNIYVANQSTGIIDKITPGGVVTPFFTGLGAPGGLAWAPNGDLLVTEGYSNAILSITPNGQSSTLFAGNPSANLSTPEEGIVIGSDGSVYVVNTGDPNIEVFNSTGTSNSVFSTAGLDTPQTITVDSQGNLYVTNALGNDVTEYNSMGQEMVFANGLDYPCFIIDVDAVPEPATYALLLGAMGMIAFLVRRKRACVSI